MSEEQKNSSNTDLSEMFSTYKSHPVEDEGRRTIISSSPIETEHKINQEKDTLKALRLLIDGCVKITKVGVGGIAVIGGLFITALATNTIDRATDIINAKLGTHISLSGEVGIVKKEDKKIPQAANITSSATTNSPSSNIPDALASKRRAALESRKAAKVIKEKQEATQQLLQ